MNHDLHIIDLSRNSAAERVRTVREFIGACEPRLRAFFMDSSREGGIYLRNPETGTELDRAARRELWPHVMDCAHECCLAVVRRRRFRFYAEGIPILACAGFLIAVHTLLGLDMVRSMGSVPVGLPLQPKVDGQMATVMVDYYAVMLSDLFDLAFMPEDLERLFYEVFALTGWRGCAGLEGRGVDAGRVQALREEAERYRGVVQGDAEWRALRAIQMEGGRQTKIGRGRGRSGQGGRGRRSVTRKQPKRSRSLHGHA